MFVRIRLRNITYVMSNSQQSKGFKINAIDFEIAISTI